MEIHRYADDHAVETFYSGCSSSEIEAVTVVEKTLVSISSWMSEKHLKMNDPKTEFIVNSSR